MVSERSTIPEHYSLTVEAPRSQKILRAKIFAEFIALLEAFGVLCLAIPKRMVEGTYWLDRSLNPKQAGIAIDDKGAISPLPMEETQVDREILNTHLITITGAELMAVCLGLARLGLL